MRSTTGSTSQRPEPVRRAAVITHGKPPTIGAALARVRSVADEHGVELLFSEDEARKHGIDQVEGQRPDIAIVLGGDGTMLRALNRFLGTGIPVLGVNFGRVGFLTSMQPDELGAGLARVFAGEFAVFELPTLEAEAAGDRWTAVNDIVCTSSTLGRMVELDWAIGGEGLGTLACDGVIISTPSGSTAYNLSNGGPVLVWGIDAMAVTFAAPHSLHARPLVVPRGSDLVVGNRTAHGSMTLLVDGQAVRSVASQGRVTVRLGPEHSLLATLPEATFFRRYRQTFGS